jgi:hypothetical protein
MPKQPKKTPSTAKPKPAKTPKTVDNPPKTSAEKFPGHSW